MSFDNESLILLPSNVPQQFASCDEFIKSQLLDGDDDSINSSLSIKIWNKSFDGRKTNELSLRIAQKSITKIWSKLYYLNNDIQSKTLTVAKRHSINLASKCVCDVNFTAMWNFPISSFPSHEARNIFLARLMDHFDKELKFLLICLARCPRTMIDDFYLLSTILKWKRNERFSI